MMSWFQRMFQRGRVEAQMDEELRFHMAAYADDLVRSGVPRAEAERRARVEFGGMEGTKEECRQALGVRWLDETRQDLLFALRGLKRRPSFTAAALLSLALAIGANTAIFTLLDAVLLRTLPVDRPNELYFLAHGPKDPSPGCNYPYYEHMRARTHVFSDLAMGTPTQMKLSRDGSVREISVMFVTGNFYSLLGVKPIAGRVISPESDKSGGPVTVVLSHDFWMREFAGNPSVVGETIYLDRQAVMVAGITAREFDGISPGYRTDVMLPMTSMAVVRRSSWETLKGRDSINSSVVVGRIRPGISESAATEDVNRAYQEFVAHPESNWVVRLNPERFSTGLVLPASRGLADLRERFSKPLWVLMAMVAAVLLVGCGNVANLLLAHGVARTREIAVRLSIGAARQRLVRQLLTESLLLAGLGALLGVGLAYAGTQFLVSLFSRGQYPLFIDVEPNVHVLAFAAAVAVVTGLLFGWAPALRATRVDLTPALKQNALRPGGVASWRSPSWWLVVTQLTLCVALLSGCGLLVRSLSNLTALDPGFRASGVLLLQVDIQHEPLSEARRPQFWSALLEGLSSLPGVTSVSLSSMTPTGTSMNSRAIAVPGFTPPKMDDRGAWTNSVSAGYFSTFGVPLVRGRLFGSEDGAGSRKVAVVSEGMARFFYKDRDPIGQTFRFGVDTLSEPYEIVGIVRDLRQRDLRHDPPHMVYTLNTQSAKAPTGGSVALRVGGNPLAVLPEARALVRRLHPSPLITYERTLERQVADSLTNEHLLATLSSFFGVMALMLAAVGIYGVMAQAVGARKKELGIRLALGASQRRILWSVLREVLALAAGGAAAGLIVAVALNERISGFLFGVTPRNPVILGGAVAVIVVVAAIAGLVPARRASGTEPLAALRVD